METTTKSRFVSFLAVFLIICSILGILIVSAQLILFYKFTNLEQFKNMANQALLMRLAHP
jgi:cytochrome c-type biogenesis protein CcmE